MKSVQIWFMKNKFFWFSFIDKHFVYNGPVFQFSISIFGTIKLVSSAYLIIKLITDKECRSLSIMMYKVGPIPHLNIMPLDIICGIERLPSSLQTWLLPVKNKIIQLNTNFGNCNALSLAISMWWQTVSKALENQCLDNERNRKFWEDAYHDA